MNSIALICTVHEECGQATSSELYARLERYQPEVIFLEAPSQDMDCFFRGNTGRKLESAPVKQYQNRMGCSLVSVDLPTPEPKFFRDYERLMQRIEARSCDLRRLMTWYSSYVFDYGFRYLNSEHNCNMWSEIYAYIRATVAELNEPELKEIFDSWMRTNELREREMLSNIQIYCGKRQFSRGVFIVGAAHRSSIIERSQSICGVHWDFSDV